MLIQLKYLPIFTKLGEMTDIDKAIWERSGRHPDQNQNEFGNPDYFWLTFWLWQSLRSLGALAMIAWNA